MAQTSRAPKGGRPHIHEVQPWTLLDYFVDYFVECRRAGREPTRTGFARKIERSEPAVRTWIRDYRFPWPLVSPGELVCLLDDTPPNELRWVSDDWLAFAGIERDDVLNQPARYLREIGFANGPRDKHIELCQRLRLKPDVEEGAMPGWILRRADAAHVPVEFRIRYAPYSGLFYIRALFGQSGNGEAPAAETFNVDQSYIISRRQQRALDTGESVLRVLEMDRDELIDYLNRNLPPYTYRGE